MLNGPVFCILTYDLIVCLRVMVGVKRHCFNLTDPNVKVVWHVRLSLPPVMVPCCDDCFHLSLITSSILVYLVVCFPPSVPVRHCSSVSNVPAFQLVIFTVPGLGLLHSPCWMCCVWSSNWEIDSESCLSPTSVCTSITVWVTEEYMSLWIMRFTVSNTQQ